MEPYTEERRCPMCGKKHILTACEYNALYMDGLPTTPVSQALKGYVLCSKCGFLYPYTPSEFEDVWSIYSSEEYQGVLHDDTLDENEKKLKLYYFLHGLSSLPLYLSHYYAEIGARDKEIGAIHDAINAINNGEDCGNYAKGLLPFQHFRMPYKFAIGPGCRLIDLYRRLGDFDSARAEMQKLRDAGYFNISSALTLYCQEEEKLMQAQNTQLL